MRILGIDPGLATMGYGIIDVEGSRLRPIEYGTIETSSKTAYSKRLYQLFEELTKIIRESEPDEVAMEELFFNKNITTAISVAQARGVEILACMQEGLEIYEYTPLQIKQAVVGYGRADKRQVQEMVKMYLHLKEIPRPDDAADGLAIAITHIHSSNSKEIFKLK
ncbi:MAG: crossover junction endodeoxyribonuclease RuvC [Peptoniphilus sp.]|nr:crossover junction endodeoxyribonuclease RuvC [Peptoniphilus sp.]MDD7363357.1 crossover junction endodeoxyribonuclease RuvC [Bacillota bacterium]MDY6044276.1 crossover junction endodeoxyribonuclease RuvC [Peptoniphilus sp.]